MEEKDKNVPETEETIEETVPAEVTEEWVAEEAPVEETPAEEIFEEEVSEEEFAKEAPAPENKPKKKRKKWSKKKIALFCVVGFFVLLGIAVGLFFLIGYLTRKDHNKKDHDFTGSAPTHLENTITVEDEEALDLAVAAAEKDPSELTPEDLAAIRERIAYLYNLANYNKIHNTDQAIAILSGDGGADFMSVEGSMFVRGMKIQSGDLYYYQKGAMIYECSVDSLQNTLEGMLNQQERAYADMEKGIYKLTGTLKGKDAKILEDDESDYLPFIIVGAPDSVQSSTKENFYKVGYYLDDPREIQNLHIEAKHIVLDANSANDKLNGKKFIEYVPATEEVPMGYYVCRFSLTYLDESCVKTAVDYLKESANSDDLHYAQYDVILEVWENGYLKRMYDDEQWAGQVKIKILDNPTTTSTSWYQISMFYSFDDSLKQFFTEADQEKYDKENWAELIIADYRKDLGVKN